jgi:hypothetical protein
MGIIDIDGIEEVGPIEMHLRASDWYRHGHQHDVRYNNVILHVVYIHDFDVIQNGRKIPTLNLGPLINPQMDFKNTLTRSDLNLPCRPFLGDVSNETMEEVKRESLILKIENKLIAADATEYSRGTLYRLIASAFGTQVNKQQFLQLVHAVPVELLVGMTYSDIYETLIRESELFSSNRSQLIHWNFKGVRPANFPTIRVKQFARLTSVLLFDESFMKAMNEFDVKTLRNHFNSLNSELEVKMSTSFMEHIITNACVPFFYFRNRATSMDIIINYLSKIKAEKNAITRRWIQNGLPLENAYDSQSLNGLYTYLCANRKCLSCGIGGSIINT